MKNRVLDDETILIVLIPVMTALGLVSIFYFAFSLAQLSEESNSLTQSPSTSTIAPSPHSSATTPSTTDQP